MANIKETIEKLRIEKQHLNKNRVQAISNCENLLREVNADDILEEFNTDVLNKKGCCAKSIFDINVGTDLSHFVPAVTQALIWVVKQQEFKNNPFVGSVNTHIGIVHLAAVPEDITKKPDYIVVAATSASVPIANDLTNYSELLPILYTSEGRELQIRPSLEKAVQRIKTGQRDTREKINYFLAHSFVEIFG